MTDKVLIQGLEVETVIGLHEWERSIQQKLVFDLELHTDISAAAASDDVTHAIDYDRASQIVIQLVQNSSFKLIEALAEAVISRLFGEFPILAISMKLSKPGAVPQAANVAVEIFRQRAEICH